MVPSFGAASKKATSSSSKIMSQDIVEPSVFTTIIECLGHCREELYAGYFEDVNLLLMSNPQNTIRILSEKHWEKLIIIIFEHCSFTAEDEKVEDHRIDLASKHLESAYLDKKGFVMKVSLLSMMLCNALSYEPDPKRARQYVVDCLRVMSAMTPAGDKDEKQIASHSTFLLTPSNTMPSATPRKSKRTSFFGRNSANFIESSPAVKSAVDASQHRKMDSFNNNVSRIVLFSVLKRIGMTNYHAMSDPMSVMWTNMLVFFDLMIDFIFHLNPDHSQDSMGVPNLKIKVQEQVDIPDVILSSSAHKLAEKYLSKDDFKPEIAPPEVRKGLEVRVLQIKSMSKLFASMNSFFKLAMHPPQKGATAMLSPRGGYSDGKESSGDESGIGSMGSFGSKSPLKYSAGDLSPPPASSDLLDGLTVDQKKKLNDSIRRIASILYYHRIAPKNSDSLSSPQPSKKTSKISIDFLGADKKKHVEQFSKALVDLVRQAWTHSGYQATLTEENDLTEVAVADNLTAKDDSTILVFHDPKAGYQTIRRREHRYANMLAEQFVIDAYQSDSTQAFIQPTPQGEMSPLISPLNARAKGSMHRRRSSAT
eukprot:TRINITY_DN38954_c0_g1_i1.p1 TRINITY_DN38954_c0_g1~~TRINITY_DN38954_c0_g1_i1.p1  ORF type:complete len:593 (+),score=120.34 TRINITY_DN38954_c0_g1_i1:523-2301(+)